MKTHVRALGVNLFLLAVSVQAKASQPKFLICSYLGTLSKSSSYGVLFLRLGVGVRLIKKATVIMQSDQNLISKFA